MNKYKELLDKIDLNGIREETERDMEWMRSIGDASGRLWSEARRELMRERRESGRRMQERGMYMRGTEGEFDLNDEAIFERYERLVNKYMINPKRSRLATQNRDPKISY